MFRTELPSLASDPDFWCKAAPIGEATAQPDAVIAPATVLQFKISESSAARIELVGDVTQEAIDRLAKILEVQKMVFPPESQLERPAVEQPAEQPAIEMPAAEPE